jgi:hypothetical protein
MKTNFQKNEGASSKIKDVDDINSEKKELTQEEFEEYIVKSGAKGSFMVYRSSKKEDELGLDEL